MRPAQHPQHQLESTHARGGVRSLIGRAFVWEYFIGWAKRSAPAVDRDGHALSRLPDASKANGPAGGEVQGQARLHRNKRLMRASMLALLCGIAFPLPVVAQGAWDLAISKTHSGNFAQGDVGRQYTISVSLAAGT